MLLNGSTVSQLLTKTLGLFKVCAAHNIKLRSAKCLLWLRPFGDLAASSPRKASVSTYTSWMAYSRWKSSRAVRTYGSLSALCRGPSTVSPTLPHSLSHCMISWSAPMTEPDNAPSKRQATPS